MKAVIIMGSTADRSFADKITKQLKDMQIDFDEQVASAHKDPTKVLEIIQSYSNKGPIIYVTIAGRSNALSGFVAANSTFPVIACPPFNDKVDMLVNIQSTLQMPSNVPVLTILDPKNCALAVQRIAFLVK
ncbi:AIR carboxylase family protein [Candidatus Neomarinimicrobiota bacterium]